MYSINLNDNTTKKNLEKVDFLLESVELNTKTFNKKKLININNK